MASVATCCALQERDAALAGQRELMSDVSELKSRLDAMKSTCRQLRLKEVTESEVTKSGVEAGKDDESRVLREKMAAMLSDEFVSVAPRQHCILKHLRLLIDRVHSHNLVRLSNAVNTVIDFIRETHFWFTAN